jgi:hypothetical protein
MVGLFTVHDPTAAGAQSAFPFGTEHVHPSPKSTDVI